MSHPSRTLTAELQNLLAHPEVATISFDCCAFGSAIKGSLTAVFHGLDGEPDGLALRRGRQPECRFSGRRHLRLHQRKRRHGSAWNVLPPDLAARIARLLSSDASAMIYNRLGADNSPTVHTNGMLFGSPCFRVCGLASIARAAPQRNLPRRARHSRDKEVAAKMSTMPVYVSLCTFFSRISRCSILFEFLFCLMSVFFWKRFRASASNPSHSLNAASACLV